MQYCFTVKMHINESFEPKLPYNTIYAPALVSRSL